jgi:hypothetical protein
MAGLLDDFAWACSLAPGRAARFQISQRSLEEAAFLGVARILAGLARQHVADNLGQRTRGK